MSELKRYSLGQRVTTDPSCGLSSTEPWIYEDSNGLYVKHSDYEKLKTENRSVKTKLGRLLGGEQEWVLVKPSEYKRIKAEVERLIKAGDILCKQAEQTAYHPEDYAPITAWNAAKQAPTDPTK